MTLKVLIIMTLMLTAQSIAAQGWYNAHWLYRRPVTVGNEGGTNLADIQVKITLNNSLFVFNHANSDGSDIRVTSSDGTTLIPFWIENWDAIAEQATLWVKVPSIPSAGTTIYLYYGNTAATSVSNGLSTFELFDDFETWDVYPTNSGWTEMADQPAATADQTSAVYDGRLLYVIGGYLIGPTTPQQTNFEYNPANNTWDTKTPMPTARWGMVAVEYDGLIYVFGGSDTYADQGNVTKNEVYNPETDTWDQTKQDMPSVLGRTGIMGVRFGNRIHLFFDIYHYEYNPGNDTYTRLNDVPLPRKWGTCAVVSDKIYIIGGEVGISGWDDTQEYDPLNDTWTTKTPYPGGKIWGMTKRKSGNQRENLCYPWSRQ